MPMTRSMSKAGLGIPLAGIKRKYNVSPPAADQNNKRLRTPVPRTVSDLCESTPHTPNEPKEILATLDIGNNSDVFANAYETTISNADVYVVASPGGKWFTDPVLEHATKHLQAKFDPKCDNILIPSPAECQWICSLGQQQEPLLTDIDRERYKQKKFLFITINDAELGELGGSHWSLLVVDTEKSMARHYNSLPGFEAQELAATKAVIGVEYLVQRRLEFVSETQTPHQNSDNLAKASSGPCGSFVFFMMKEILNMAFEPDGQLKTHVRLPLPPESGMKFNSMHEWIDMKRLLESRRKNRECDDSACTSEVADHGFQGEAELEFGSSEYSKPNNDDSQFGTGAYGDQSDDDGSEFEMKTLLSRATTTRCQRMMKSMRKRSRWHPGSGSSVSEKRSLRNFIARMRTAPLGKIWRMTLVPLKHQNVMQRKAKTKHPK
jgi:hypothetical protein